MSSRNSTLADFVVAVGDDLQWMESLDGYQVTRTSQNMAFATRGEPFRMTAPDGRDWLAIADLLVGPEASANVDPRHWRGRFAAVELDPTSARLRAFTDHIGTLPLYWTRDRAGFAITTDLSTLEHRPGTDLDIDETAVYHFLNFACIPAPWTIHAGIRSLEPGSSIRLSQDSANTELWYVPEYPSDLQGSDEELAEQMRAHMVEAVYRHRPDASGKWGCFLSGGTDSSSITSILARQPGAPDTVQTCSIGFSEAGYDELEFAGIASRACGAQPHLAQVSQDDAMGMLDAVMAAYEQPFGNASAIPTLACSRLGNSLGMTTMLGGDGGDEIFGGNERYAKDAVMERFHTLPWPVKRSAAAIGALVQGRGSRFLNRVGNFTRRASLANPDRFYTDDAFASEAFDELLTPAFRAHVPKDASLQAMRTMYAKGGGDAESLHRIMRLDLLMAIAQNDIIKVHRACKASGVAVRFPYIDVDLVDFCGRLPARYKVHGTTKRYLFKQATANILPPEILQKPKQGFGLPISVWMRGTGPLRDHLHDLVLDPNARTRKWIEPAYVRKLVEGHDAGHWDHSDHLWRLLVLERWMREHTRAH